MGTAVFILHFVTVVILVVLFAALSLPPLGTVKEVANSGIICMTLSNSDKFLHECDQDGSKKATPLVVSVC